MDEEEIKSDFIINACLISINETFHYSEIIRYTLNITLPRGKFFLQVLKVVSKHFYFLTSLFLTSPPLSSMLNII